MAERTAFFLSDQTGVTAETLGHSLLTQFDGRNFRQVTLPFIDSEDKAREAVAKIDEICADDTARPIVFSTLVQPELRDIVRQAKGNMSDAARIAGVDRTTLYRLMQKHGLERHDLLTSVD